MLGEESVSETHLLTWGKAMPIWALATVIRVSTARRFRCLSAIGSRSFDESMASVKVAIIPSNWLSKKVSRAIFDFEIDFGLAAFSTIRANDFSACRT